MARGNRSDQQGERTEDERERAREERARRRAAERGEPPAPAASELTDPHIELPGVHAGPADVELEPEPVDVGAVPPGTPAEPPSDAVAPPPPEIAQDLGEDVIEEPPGSAEPAHATDTEEAPVAHAPVVPAAPYPPRTGIPPLPPLPPRLAPRAPGASGGSARRRLLARAGALLALVAVAVALLVVIHPFSGSGKTTTVKVAPAVKVVIPEGETRLQIAEIAAADGLTGSYRAASRHSSLLSPSEYGAPASTPDLEGFLFPDTFDIDHGAPVGELVEAQLMDFRSRFGAAQIAAARALHLTPYELLTVASMVEREALIPADRPRIAAVIYNRLSQGMPLGIDATIYYAVELKSGIATYTHELTEAQLHIDSPYNTRLHTGLPPTPISNPGLASIEAAAHPAHVPYLYYVAGADGCGEQVFSTTQAQFEVDAAAYHAAVARNGGRPPTCRKK